jgi:hypothetical protein
MHAAKSQFLPSMIHSRLRGLSILTAVALISSCSRTAPADPGMVAAWMQSLYGAFRVERVSPPVASRLLVYSTAALYSGLASTDESLPPLSRSLNRFPTLPAAEEGKEHDATLVAVAAERVVLDSLLREALPTTRAAMRRLTHRP